MDKRRLFAATYGHLSIDILNSSVAMILVAVSDRYQLSISQIGFGALVYSITAAMSQPLFGSLTDRLRGRWVGAVGLLWTVVFFALASLMPSYALFLTTLMIGGLGSGAFHAAGLLNSSLSGGNRPTTATSIFFVGGQSGLALGPILAGLLLARMGLAAMPWMALAMAPAGLAMLIFMNDPLPIAPPRPRSTSAAAQDRATSGASARAAAAGAGATVMLTAIFLIITFRSGTAQSFSTLLPKFYADQGISSATYGFMLGAFAFAGAVGTFIGGFLGDRFNRRLVLSTVLVASSPFAWLMLHSSGWSFVLSAVLAGLLLSIPHSILLVMAQEVAPHRRGLVGGLVLGFMFAAGSTVAWLGSMAADWLGLLPVLSAMALMPVLAGLCALLLPAGSPLREEAVEAVPAGSAAD